MNRKKAVVVIVLALFALLAAALYIARDNGGSDLVVSMTEKGYSPSEVTARVGQTVTFVNETLDMDFWPASDPHPVHTDYQAFDSMAPIPPGQSWSFTFEQPGVWAMHDHLSPYLLGKVTVLDAAGSRVGDRGCATVPDSKQCWEERLLSVMNKKGLSATFDEIADLYASQPAFPGMCHNILHNLGHKAYAAYIKDPESIIDPKVSYCANGFYHGFMESYLNANPDLSAAHDICAYIDESLRGESPDAGLQCYHGIGHGLIAAGFQSRRAIDSAEDIIAPALAYCERAADTEEQLYRCASGVFNGVANFYITGEYGLKADPKDPFAICKVQPDQHKEACYGNLNSTIFWMADNDFGEAAKHIVSLEDDEYKEMSVRYLAGLATLDVAKVDPAKAVNECRALGSLRDACIRGFAHGFLEHGQPAREYEQAIAFCQSPVLAPDEAKVCLDYSLLNLGGWYSRDKVTQICRSLSSDLKAYCSDEN